MKPVHWQALGTALLVPLLVGASAREEQVPAWDAAYVDPDTWSLILLSVPGAKSVVQLPGGLRHHLIRAFGSDGTGVYALTARGILKVQFNPLRQEIVPGTAELGILWSLTVVKQSGHIFASGMASGVCGIFEIDPVAGTMRTVDDGAYPLCGGGGGVVSPDGTRAVRHVHGSLQVTELSTGAVRQIPGFGTPAKNNEGHPISAWDDAMWMNRTRWSPDGRWISVVDENKRIVLVDSGNLAHRKHLGSSFAGAEWSPDSRYLLVGKTEFRCALSLFFFSLEAIDVETGKRSKIAGSHCRVLTDALGWMDPSIAQSTVGPRSGFAP
jgi:hypothetical protein